MACSQIKRIVALLRRSDEYRETEHPSLMKGTDTPM
jgi:hypothetical protein